MELRLSHNERKARVIWSVQSSYLNKEQALLAKKLQVDGVRVEYSPDLKEETIAFLRDLESGFKAKSEMPTVMLDITPAARGKIVGLDESRKLEFGKEVVILREGAEGDCDFQVTSLNWDVLFKTEAIVYLGYGDAALKVTKVDGDSVFTEVIQGGFIHENMEVHVPETKKIANFDIDALHLEGFVDKGVNAIIIPGLSALDQIEQLRKKFPKNTEGSPWLIYRIDSAESYERTSQVLDVVDGVIVSRRELALTSNPAMVPILTKELIQLCRSHAKAVFVASEMLGSMRHNVTPTRAEVSDVANAVFDGADAVMLSEEVAAGNYAAKAYEMASAIIQDVEAQSEQLVQNWETKEFSIKDEMDAICSGAVKTAKRVGAKAIVCITKTGNTALRLSSLNQDIPVLAVTYDERVKRRLSILRGVKGLVLEAEPGMDELFGNVNDLLKEHADLNVGDRIIFVTVTISSMSRESSNLFTIQTVQ